MTSNAQEEWKLSVFRPGGSRSYRGIVLTAALLGVLLAAPAQAVVFTVNSPSDVVDAAPGNGACETAPGNGVCTLRAAIQEANALSGTDEIVLSPGNYVLTIDTELSITGSLILTGGGQSSTIIDGNGSARPTRGVLFIRSGSTVNISGVTIRNGQRSFGGGIDNLGGTVTLTQSTVSGNSANRSGGGIYNDFGGTVTLTQSTVSNNSTNSDGGGIFNGGTVTLTQSTVSGNSARSNGGGIYNNHGSLTLTQSTVSDNTAGTNGGGIFNVAATVTLTQSTVSGNSAGSNGGGIFNDGGTLTLTQSTVSSNGADITGGGIRNFGSSTLTLTQSTVSGNTAGTSGGGIFNSTTGTVNIFNGTVVGNEGAGIFNTAGGVMTFQNSIIAGNGILIGSGILADCGGTVTSNGFNLMSSTTTGCTVVGGGVTVANPLLGPLQHNGGPTQTHALLPGSPALDAGNPGGCGDQLGELLTVDQRGFPRPEGGRCDIGAYELFTGPNTSVLAAVLPSSRSVQLGTTATAFATIINSGQSVAVSCGIAVLSNVPAAFSYQTTDPATNQVTGFPNTPANIAAGQAQSYVIAITPTAPIAPTDVQLNFACVNTNPAPITTGLNTLLFSASNTPVPDIVALGATPPPDPGIVNIPGTNGTGVFAVAVVNVGASGSITASADTGSAALPVNISLCQTDPATGQCISGIAPSVATTINANETPTFGIFVQGSGNVPFDPAVNRIFVRFTDGGNVTRGSTSVAVRTQ